MRQTNLWVGGVSILTIAFLAIALSATGLSVASAEETVDKNASQVILTLENKVNAASFNPESRDDKIRLARIEHYLRLARKYDSEEWFYNRDDALARAKSILQHHQRKKESMYARI